MCLPMIAYLRGTIKYRGEDYLVLEIGGVGYQVFVTTKFLEAQKVGAEIELYTYELVREDADDLYGFTAHDDLKLFEQLNTVSGIGPRSAMAVLEAAPASELVKAILKGDEKTLVSVYGISQKKAEKIIMELKGKVDKLEVGSSGTARRSEIQTSGAINVIEALTGLGYTQDQARNALRQIPNEAERPEEMVKEALKILGGRRQ